MSVLKFALVLTNKFLAMHVARSPNIIGFHPSLSNLGSMASKREGLKDCNKIAAGKVVERVSMSLE